MIEAAFLAGVGVLPVGRGAEGVAGGVSDLVVVHDARLAIAWAGDFPIGISHLEVEARRMVGEV